MKRPAGRAAPVLKRPAAAVPRAKGFVMPPILFEDGDEDRGRNCFTSKHYGRAKSAAVRAGLSRAQVDGAKRAALAASAKVWDSKFKKGDSS